DTITLSYISNDTSTELKIRSWKNKNTLLTLYEKTVCYFLADVTKNYFPSHRYSQDIGQEIKILESDKNNFQFYSHSNNMLLTPDSFLKTMSINSISNTDSILSVIPLACDVLESNDEGAIQNDITLFTRYSPQELRDAYLNAREGIEAGR